MKYLVIALILFPLSLFAEIIERNTPGPGNTPGPLGCCVLTFKDNSRQCFTVGYENQCSKWAKKKRTKKWQWSRSDYNCKDNHDVCVNTPEWLKKK